MVKRITVLIFLLLSLFYGTEAALAESQFQVQNLTPGKYARIGSKLTLDTGITAWSYDDQNRIIYAVSADSNRLFAIKVDTLTVLRELKLNMTPLDIEYFQGKIYLALKDQEIAVLDASTGQLLNSYQVNRNLDRIEVNEKNVYFVGLGEKEPVGVLDLVYGEVSTLRQGTYELTYKNPEILLMRERNILLVAESGTVPCKLSAIWLNTLDTNNIYSYNLPVRPDQVKRKLLKTGTNGVFFAGHVFILENIFKPITYVGNAVMLYSSTIITEISMFNLYDQNHAYLAAPLKAALTNDRNNLFTLSWDGRTIGVYPQIKMLNPAYNVSYAGLPGREAKFYAPVDIANHPAKNTLTRFIDAGIIYTNIDPVKEKPVINPNAYLSRAQFVDMLVRALGVNVTGSGYAYKDVPKTAWYYDAVRQASVLGIITPAKGYFYPQRPLTKAEMADMVVRAFKNTIPFNWPLKTFKDVSKKHTYKGSIDLAVRAGLVPGVPNNGYYKPAAKVTRAEAAVMIEQALNKERKNAPSDQYLKELILGHELTSIYLYRTVYNKEAIKGLAKNQTGGGYRSIYEAGSLAYADVRDELYRNGYNIKLTPQGEYYVVKILNKADRYAAVQLLGVTYQLEISGPDLHILDVVDNTGTYYLRRTPANTWIIYSASYLH